MTQENLIKQLLDLGLYIIPLFSVENGVCKCGDKKCSSPGKHPLLRYNWKVVATNDFEKIKGWIEEFKLINFAVATGRKSSVTKKFLVVVDIDKSEHEIMNQLPETFSYRTGSGGYHYWYWSKYPIKNSVSLVADEVDIRGTNGYVVIPPSKHISGNSYEMVSDKEIVDLPNFIQELIRSKKSDEVKETSKTEKKSKKERGFCEATKKWSLYQIHEIEKLLETGTIIPLGARNVTVFRMLCSFRAKGILEYSDLLSLGFKLRSYVESPETFSDEEIGLIARSVMKYPAYNTSHKKVNDCYLRWLENNKIKSDEEFRTKLFELDELFFAKCLKKSMNDEGQFVSIKQIILAREQFMKTNGLMYFSSYKMQLLAKKLLEMGFTKTRTSKRNVWNLIIELS